MDLLERYLQAVGNYLPDATREDTLAELRANLLEQMDARAEELGRPLVDAEVGDVLRAHGKPELVALRYLPQRSLIGPTVYPFYQYTVRKALPLVLFVYAIANAAPLLTAHGGNSAGSLVGHAVLGIVPTLLLFFAIVTIVFALIESGQRKYGAGTKSGAWDPAKLPALQRQGEKKHRSLFSRIADLAVHVAWMGYVVLIPFHLFLAIGPGTFFLRAISAKLAPVWHNFFALLMVLLTMQLVMKIMALRDGPRPWEKPMELVVGVMGAAATGMLAFASVLLVPASGAANVDRLAATNYWLSRNFKIILFFVAAGLLVNAWKYLKPTMPASRFAF